MENNDIDMRKYGYVEDNTYVDTYEGKYAPAVEPGKPKFDKFAMFRNECGFATTMGLESRNYIGTDEVIATNGDGTENPTEWYEHSEFPVATEE